MYLCPSYTNYFESLDLLKSHANTIHEKDDCPEATQSDDQSEPDLDEEELGPEIHLPSDNTMSIISSSIKPCAAVNHSVPSTDAVASICGDDADSAALHDCQQMYVNDTEKSETLYISSTKDYRCFL